MDVSIQNKLDYIKKREFLLDENTSCIVIDDFINTFYLYLLNNMNSLCEDDIFTLYFALSTLYTKKGDDEGLLKVIKQWEGYYPNDPYPKMKLGDIYYWYFKNNKLAIEKYDESIKLSEKEEFSYVTSISMKALLLFEMRKYDDCFETLIESRSSLSQEYFVKELMDRKIYKKDLQNILIKIRLGNSDKETLLQIEQIISKYE